MLQSFSRKGLNPTIMLQCYRCKQKPDQQFILLLCDHMICSSCLNKFSSMRNNGYEGIKCPCGVLTYFKVVEENQVRKYISANEPTYQEQESDGEQNYGKDDYNRISNGISKERVKININQNNYHQNQRQNRNSSSRPSAGIIQSKNTSSTKNISRLNTQTFSRVNIESHRQNDNTPDYFRDKLMLQQSKYPLITNTNKKHYQQFGEERDTGAFNQTIALPTTHNIRQRQNKNQRKIQNSQATQYCPRPTHYQPQYIQSQSLISQNGQEKQNYNPNMQGKRKIKKQSKPKSLKTQQYYLQEIQNSQEQSQFSEIIQKRKARNTWHENQLAQQLKSQIKFMQISHKKLLQSLERAYQRAVKKINDDYNNLQNNLKDLCLQNIVMDRSESHVDFGRIVKMRYETYVAKNVQKLTQQLRVYGYKEIAKPFNQLSTKYQPSAHTQKMRQHQIQRFSSPQPYRSHMQTEPASIFGGSQLHKNNYHKDISYNSAQLGNANAQNQQFKAQKYLQTIHSPACQYGQPSNKLLKKGIKRRTNVIIQL